MRGLLSDICIGIAGLAFSLRMRRTFRAFRALDLMIAGLPQHGEQNG